MKEALFVYGTLCPGRANEHILRVMEGAFERARVRGFHYPDGWLQGFPYPGIDLDDSGPEIPGYIFTSSELHMHWGRLDAFEGENYTRVQTTAMTLSGESRWVHVYVINRGQP